MNLIYQRSDGQVAYWHNKNDFFKVIQIKITGLPQSTLQVLSLQSKITTSPRQGGSKELEFHNMELLTL